MMRAIRRYVYRCGFRPEPGSIFHSPSLAWIYGQSDRRARGGDR